MKPNNQTAAICGLFCGICPSYPQQCHGCLSDKLTKSCTVCPNGFRTCAKEHKVTRCYECVEFPCARISEFSTQHIENGICHHETVIEDLEYMKQNSVEKFVAQKTAENTCKDCGKLIYWMDKNTHKCD